MSTDGQSLSATISCTIDAANSPTDNSTVCRAIRATILSAIFEAIKSTNDAAKCYTDYAAKLETFFTTDESAVRPSIIAAQYCTFNAAIKSTYCKTLCTAF